MKSAVRMLSVEATRLPTFTWLVGENSTPFGLIRKIWPLAVIAPWMTDTSEPSTRLSATALAPGWTKFTVLPLPTEKPCQSIASLFEAWLMVMALPLWLMLPLPATMLPPRREGACRPALASAGQRKGRDNEQRLRGLALATAAGTLRYGLPGPDGRIPDDAINMIHEITSFKTMRCRSR